MAQHINNTTNMAAVSRKQTAQLNYLRIAPRKVRMIANLLKGLPVNEAEAQLLLQRRRPAKPLLKLLRSAAANAAHNSRLNSEKLYVESVRVDQGPMLKRVLPRARGMATPIQKKMSHVTLVLAENPNLKPIRFKIAVSKKIKKAGGETRKEKRVPDKKQAEMIQQKNPGFFKKIFRRKSV